MVNLPNTLTLMRVLLVPVFVILMMDGRMEAALWVFLIAALTDGLDGLAARMLDQKTKVGRYLDPIADKTLAITAYLVLTIQGLIPDWLTVVVISRDVIIVGGFLVIFMIKGEGIEVRPSLISKVTTFFQFMTVLLSLATPESGMMPILFATTALFTVLSGLDYIYKGLRAVEV